MFIATVFGTTFVISLISVFTNGNYILDIRETKLNAYRYEGGLLKGISCREGDACRDVYIRDLPEII